MNQKVAGSSPAERALESSANAPAGLSLPLPTRS